MTSYKLDFREDALKEWRALSGSVREQFKKKLAERQVHPHVPASRLSGLPRCYKIKLRRAGFRLIYQVEDDVLIILVIAVGKRERDAVYEAAAKRLQ